MKPTKKIKLPPTLNESKKLPQTSHTKKRVDIFNNYNNIMNNNFQEDFKCCYNLNINGTKLNLFKEKRTNQLEKKIKIKPKININFIVDSQPQSEEDNSQVAEDSSNEINEDLNFRRTFLTNALNNAQSNAMKPNKEKPSHTSMMKTHYVGKEFEFFKKESSFDLKNFIKEVSTAQQKIDDETEEIQKMLKYTKAAKDKIKSKMIDDKLKSELGSNNGYLRYSGYTGYYGYKALEDINNVHKNLNRKNLHFRNSTNDFYKFEKDKLKNLEKMKNFKNKFLVSNNNLSRMISKCEQKSLPKIAKIF
jgi:hypothetical protein